MLNISNDKTKLEDLNKKYSALIKVEAKKSSKVLRSIILSSFLITLVILFLPWTQNIRSNGYITTLLPNQKPVIVNSVIGGRIEEWFVKEGDFVKKGDTLLRVSEIKDAYFDNDLLERTKNQVDLKNESLVNYDEKIELQTNQLQMLTKQKNLKISQAKNKLAQVKLKVQNDSINFEAAKVNYKIAEAQYLRMEQLYEKGLKSKVDFEQKKIKLQQSESYELSAKNKWLNTQNDVINAAIELNGIIVKYEVDYNKVLSDRNATVSKKLQEQSNLNKLKNTYSNYVYRNGLYYITASQSGFVTKTKAYGIGELIKSGQEILSLMPQDYDLSIEMYVDPIDLPLVKVHEKVRIQFDGWPAIVFSGWPNSSYGTFGGEIFAIDQFISPNGKYRILVQPDAKDKTWPNALRFGSGAKVLIMLNDVPIWYELWRNINGFPPEYYIVESDKKEKK